ncbi:hypothetical protein AMATHDRAFT_42349 [Amanita thiersii Skay4041]|uniref:Cytochrome P450 n=1 Tax=Amanita thiersii Skay4041 TaxID=703135 RepID=A0A2A9NCF6_9AGAR|nr:hypothetical protein AMATHDRAFT_42349 [Amanita thiersii Skay4041]
MISLDFNLVACLSSVVLMFFIYRKNKRSGYKNLPLPPGPKGRLLVGNLLDIPRRAEWITYHEWCTEFNTDILHLDLLGTSVIILDTSEAATELLERRSTIYSGRPRSPMLHDLMGWDFALGFKNYSPTWRMIRKLAHHSFHVTAAQKFSPHILKATRGFLRRMLQKPNDFMGNLHHMTGEVVLSITYGLDILPENDPFIEVVEKAIAPAFVAWMPGAGFKAKARLWSQLAMEMVEEPYNAAKKRISTGSYYPSLVSDSLSQLKPTEDIVEMERLIKWTAGSMYGAGVDTTAAAISWCIFSFLAYPEVFRKAQVEIDSVLQAGELPTFDDQESLPYITAICMETLRWRTVAPIAIPHMVAVDDVYKGYRIPKGSIVIPNGWAMLHNENVYSDPLTFNPDRFIKNGKINKEVRDPAHAIWGFGRRVCPGRFLAFPSIWIMVASIVSVFEVSKALDPSGNVIEPSEDFIPGLVCAPKSFTCLMKPRSKKHEQAILVTENEQYEY